MVKLAFAIPGDINLPAGSHVYARRVMAMLPALGISVTHLPLPDGFPCINASILAETRRMLQDLPEGTVILADGFAYGVMPAEFIAEFRHPIVALVHHPLYLETGLTEPKRRDFYALESRALAQACHIIVSSETTAAELIAGFGIPTAKITVAAPGTDPALRSPGTGSLTPQVLAVGSVIPRKAYDLLVRALLPAADRDWHLTIAGATDLNSQAIAALHAAIAETGFATRVALPGTVDSKQLEALYAAADIFVSASLYEGYGMALAEALARGLPIVCTTGGAAAMTVPDGAAIKVRPGDVGALSDALCSLLDDRVRRLKLGDAAWIAGQGLSRWDTTVKSIASVVQAIKQRTAITPPPSL